MLSRRAFPGKNFVPLLTSIKVCFRKSSEEPSHSAPICGPQKPLNFRRSWFSHDFSATHVSILTSEFSKIFSKISSANNRTFRYPRRNQSEIVLLVVVSVHDFSPEPSSAHQGSTSDLLRFHDRMAASKPTSWLSLPSHFLFHSVMV